MSSRPHRYQPIRLLRLGGLLALLLPLLAQVTPAQSFNGATGPAAPPTTSRSGDPAQRTPPLTLHERRVQQAARLAATAAPQSALPTAALPATRAMLSLPRAIDGTFSGGTRTVLETHPDAFTLPGGTTAANATPVLNLPRGTTSIAFTTSRTGEERFGMYFTLRGRVEVKPRWADWTTPDQVYRWSTSDSDAINERHHLTLPAAAIFTDTVDIRFRCSTGTLALQNLGSCDFGAIESYDDAPTWTPWPASWNTTNETNGLAPDNIQMTTDPMGILAPEDGGYLAFDLRQPNSTHRYISPVFQLPALTAGDVLTASLRYSAAYYASDPNTNRDPIRLKLLTTHPTTPSLRLPWPLIEAIPPANLQPWTSAAGFLDLEPENMHLLSEATSALIIEVPFHKNRESRQVGIDSIALYWNGQHLPLPVFCPNDSDCDGLTDLLELNIHPAPWIYGHMPPEQRLALTLNPFNPDTDGDGLLDPWELPWWIPGAGFNLDGQPGPELTRDQVFGPYSASAERIAPLPNVLPTPFTGFVQPPDPFRQDLYVEIDWQDCRVGGCPGDSLKLDPTHHQPDIQALRDVIWQFRQTATHNLPGIPIGVNLNILVDEAIQHIPNCEGGRIDQKQSHFGTAAQRNRATWSQVRPIRERLYRYLWSGHSTYGGGPGIEQASCPTPDLADLIAQGLMLAPLPAYDWSPFGAAEIGGANIVASLGPLWVCPANTNILCFREAAGGQVPPRPGIFPAYLHTINGLPHPIDVWDINVPMNMMLGVAETEGVRQVWGRSLMHLLGHSLGLVDHAIVNNDPNLPATDRNGDHRPDRLEVEHYGVGSWAFQFIPRLGAPMNHIEADPDYFGLGIRDVDLDGVIEQQDNCPGIFNPSQDNLDDDETGDECDDDQDADGMPDGDRFHRDSMLVSSSPAIDPSPFDTDNDGMGNVVDPDDDNDGIDDTDDNCHLIGNTQQIDADSDGAGDGCDDDADDDGIASLLETALGADPLDPVSQPEYIGQATTCADGLDNDGDGLVDAADTNCMDPDHDSAPTSSDNCPLASNPGWQDADGDGIGDLCDPTPLPANNAPTVTGLAAVVVDEGAQRDFQAIGADPDGDALAYQWDLSGNGVFLGAGDQVSFATTPLGLDGPAIQQIGVQVQDGWGLTATATTTVTIRNLPPVVQFSTVPTMPVAMNATTTFTATFIDPGILDTHTARWSWGDGSASAGVIAEADGSGHTTAHHAYEQAGSYTITLELTDDDGATTLVTAPIQVGLPSAQMTSQWSNAHEFQSTARITVELDFPAVVETTVRYTTAKAMGLGGHATAGSDYTSISGTLHFQAGETAKTVVVPILDDALAETDERFIVALHTPTGLMIGTIDRTQVTILANDGLSMGTSMMISDEGTSVQVTVQLNGSANQPVTVQYATRDGTATWLQGDYQKTTGTLTFAPGETTKTITIQLLADGAAEGNETFWVDLSRPERAQVLAPMSTQVTIRNVCGPPLC